MDKRPDNSLPQPEPIEGLVARFERRLRAQHTLSGVVEGACLGLMVIGVAIAAIRTEWADPAYWWVWLVAALALTIAGAAYRAMQPIDTVDAARQIDRAHGLHDRISTAVSLASRQDLSATDTAFVRAQLNDAIRHVDSVELHQAAPWRRPPDTLLLTIVLVAVLAIGFLPMAEHEETLPEPFQVRHAPVLDAATLALERSRLEQFRRDIEDLSDDEAEELAREIESLLDAVEAREISDREFAERIDELLEERFGDTTEGDSLAALERALADAAAETAAEHADVLEEHEELERALDALEDGDFQEAADALEELAERLDDGDLSPEEASRLADVLERFADHLDGHEDRLQDLFDSNRDRFESLADQFDGLDGEGLEGQEQLLEDARQAMEDAANQRDQFADSDTRRQVEQLSRELEEAAEELRDDPSDAQDRPDDGHRGDEQQPDDADPQQGGENGDDEQDGRDVVDEDRIDDGEAQRGQEQQDRDEPDYRDRPGRQLSDAAEQLEEMEEQRQRQEQRQRARDQLEDMRENMSRGGEDDEERAEQMEDFLDRARGEGADASDQDQDEAEGPSEEQGGDDGQAEAEESANGEGSGGASEDGTTDEGWAGDDEELDFEYREEHLEGAESGEGPSRSEIIESAGEEGFATTEYQDVFADYEAIAEEVMEREQVPDGYRHYIERYFQLIRPQQ